MEDKLLLEKLAGEDSGSPCVDDQLLINDEDNVSEGLGSESEFAPTGSYEDFLNMDKTVRYRRIFYSSSYSFRPCSSFRP